MPHWRSQRHRSVTARDLNYSEQLQPKELLMLRWSLAFFIFALIAAVFGFGGLAAGAASIGKILFVAFLIVAAVMAVMGRLPKGV